MKSLQESELFRTGYLADGQWHQAASTFDVTNPATGEVIAQVAKAGKAETEQAIAAAERAFPAWRAQTAKARAEILTRWYQLIIENKRWLGQLMTTEQGKPLKEAEGEVEYAASFIQWFAEQAKRTNGEIIPPAKPGSRILATREPIGVVAAITPWNFPMAMLTRKLGPALAAGCTGIIKPANNTPLSAFALLALAKEAGVPDGVLNAVAGDTHAISDAIMASKAVRKISFTGSTQVGKLLMRNAAETMKKVSMELGGNAPYIVFDDADIDAAVQGAIANKFRNAGQVCVSVNRFYIHNAIYDRFTQQLAAEVNKLKVGNGMEEGVIVGPLIEASAVEKVEQHVNDAVAKGGKLLAGGERHAL
ncbi:MAG: NAD-dependent succinate-semialdehyde dehydrogenase, partial [Pantoea agglomerans]